MSKPIPSIQKFMTTAPHTIEADRPITEARASFAELNIRHLPVMQGGRLVGVLTARDLALIESIAGADPTQVTVRDAMSTDVYAVSPDASLDEVAREMASKKYGSAVVVQNQKVVGIFTTVDLANALVSLLETRLAH